MIHLIADKATKRLWSRDRLIHFDIVYANTKNFLSKELRFKIFKEADFVFHIEKRVC